MDETIRIYQPNLITEVSEYVGRHAGAQKQKEPEEQPIEALEPISVVEELKTFYESEPEPEPDKKDPWKKETYLDTLKGVLKSLQRKERLLTLKHPWFNLIYNWIIAVLIFALFIAFWKWGVDIRNRNKERAIRESVYAEVQAQEQAKETARLEALKAEQESEEYIVNMMATTLSKMYYGIKNFEEKYHYGDADFETYGRCAWNRMLNSRYSDDFNKVVFQKEQFLACYENNPDIEPYHSMAKRHIQKWRSETVAPVSNDYIYAELTPNGVYLKNDYNADGYARRWRVS